MPIRRDILTSFDFPQPLIESAATEPTLEPNALRSRNEKSVYLIGLLFIGCALLFSQDKQSGPDGTWRVEGVGIPFPWEIVLIESMDPTNWSGL